MKIEDKLVTSVISGLKALYGQDVPAAQVQLQKTKKEFEGHLTLVVFPFLKMSKKGPEQTAQEGVQYIQYVTELSQYTSVNIGTGIIPMSEYLNMMTTVGASGAVYAILLAFGMLFPNQQLFIFPLPFPIKAKFFVIGYALIELYAGFANNPGDNVAHFAHLGGMIFGFILIMYWRKKNRNNGTYYN